MKTFPEMASDNYRNRILGKSKIQYNINTNNG